ncbi:MAG: AI-2E family transporter, partial [Pseudoclavibacter sp.]
DAGASASAAADATDRETAAPEVAEPTASGNAHGTARGTATSPAQSPPADARTRSIATTIVTAVMARPLQVGFLLTLGGILAYLLMTTLSTVSGTLVSVAIALFIALGLDPAIIWFENHGVKRLWGIVIVIVATVLVFAAVVGIIVPIVTTQIVQFAASVPDLVNGFLASNVYAWLQDQIGANIGQTLRDLSGSLLDPNTLSVIGGGIFQVGAGIVGGLSSTLIVFVLTLYFTASLRGMKQGFYRLTPAWSRPRVSDLTERITRSIGDYVKGMVLLATLNAIFTLIAFWALGLPYPALFALVALMLTFIPLVGTVAFWVVGSSVAVIADPVMGLIFAGLYLVYMQVEAYVLTPRIMNRAIAVPGALVVIGALIGGALLGLLGALVAIPVTASILLIIKEIVIPDQDAKVAPPVA